MAVKLKVVHSVAGIRNVFARMPFRFGVVTMRAAPLLTLAVIVVLLWFAIRWLRSLSGKPRPS